VLWRSDGWRRCVGTDGGVPAGHSIQTGDRFSIGPSKCYIWETTASTSQSVSGIGVSESVQCSSDSRTQEATSASVTMLSVIVFCVVIIAIANKSGIQSEPS
jgi:hypothetical protein